MANQASPSHAAKLRGSRPGRRFTLLRERQTQFLLYQDLSVARQSLRTMPTHAGETRARVDRSVRGLDHNGLRRRRPRKRQTMSR